MKLNNKGFTLVELLGVIVILVAILLIAIPTITSSIERSKEKQLNGKIDLIISGAELYISDIKTSSNSCHIELSTLRSGDYITAKTLIDPTSDSEANISGFVVYSKTASGVEFIFCENADDNETKCDVETICS